MSQACAGADYVFHCAPPFFIEASDPATQLLAPAVEGTRNVLEACARAGPRLKRVVLTSSVAAVKGGDSAAPPSAGELYTEQDWNWTSTIENGEGYWVSKTQAERTAWELAETHGLDLVTILPNFIMGPVLSAALPDPTSVGFLKAWLEGTPSSGEIVFAPDVRDVARAHLLAALSPVASGRYIVSDDAAASPAFISRTLSERFGHVWDIPESTEDFPATPSIDNTKVQQQLGLQLTPLATTLVDMATTLVALGIANPRLKPPAEDAAERA